MKTMIKAGIKIIPMDQTNRHMHQPSSNELQSLNDNLDENIQRNLQDMPLGDADATPVNNKQDQQTSPPDGEIQNRITE